MKPKTRLQKAVARSINLLPPLSRHQYAEAIKDMPHIAKCNAKGQYTCLECGHQWQGEKAERTICPHCGTKVQVETDRTQKHKLTDYFAVITKCNGFQVVRMFLFKAMLRKGQKAEYQYMEAFQRWITPKGENVIVGKRRHFLCHYIDVWDVESDLEIRAEHEVHSLIPTAIVGRISVIPELKRNGFSGDFLGLNPFRYMTALLKDPRIETLLKAGQTALARHFILSDYRFAQSWPMIKIAIRNHYKVADATMWLDLISALEYCGKDTHNAKYICPSILCEAHDHWIKKQSELQRKERERRERERYFADIKQRELDETAYIGSKGKFFGIAITDGEIIIKVLDSVKAFFDEGATLSHCVASNKYYNKPNSLILSARIDDKSIETIEIDLQSMEIVQCRGSHNQSSQYHDRILSLMRANMDEVAKLIA